MTIDNETKIIRSYIEQYNYSASKFSKKAGVNVHSVLRLISDDSYNPTRRTFKKMYDVVPREFYTHFIK